MRFLFLIVVLISINGFSQWKSYIISVKGDTLNRVDMNGRKQGPWSIHADELRGERGYEEEGYFENDKKEGTWRRYSLDGDKIAEENYRWGNKDGKCSYYTYTGGLLRVESWKAVNPDNPMDTVDVYDPKDPTKIVDRVVVKLSGFTLKHGLWTYYDPREGTVEETERYWLDKLATDNEEKDEELKPIGISTSKNKSDTTGKNTTSKPQVVLDYEKKNTGKKKVKTRDGQTGY